MTRLCFAQRARLLVRLERDLGVEARQVVVANDDENAEIAADHGFAVLWQSNDHLGRRFNDGIEFACVDGAADLVVVEGSDSWVDPAWFAQGLPDLTIQHGGWYAIVARDGSSLHELDVAYQGGCAPWIIPRPLLAACGYRPCDDFLNRGINTSIAAGVARRFGYPGWRRVDVHPLQLVGFRSGVQITSTDELVDRYETRRHPDPWERLAAVYDADLVDMARAYYEQGAE